MTLSEKESQKFAAALAASQLVEDGMAVGLGTGSTAAHLVSILGDRVRQGLNISAVPTSEATRAMAEAHGIPLVGFADCDHLDLTIDGADEIARGTLDLIKGGGGALLREKLVASASSALVIIADGSKLADRLGGFPLPVEIVPFGWELTMRRIGDRCRDVGLRHDLAGRPYLTDGGHYIVDCDVSGTDDVAALDRDLASIVGVVETGFFIGLAREAFVAGPGGVERLRREL
jgi:ribose 5-phosphate isomerase A